MTKNNLNYQAIVSSDWNECLAPCGPFDFISFNHPQLTPDLTTIFQQYTGNTISLGKAARQIRDLLPDPITAEQMDAYLDKSFITYTGVPELIEWCLNKNILFMINTTGMVGYFQRIFAKNLLPPVPVVSAHPMIRFGQRKSDPPYLYDLIEIQDKSKNTAAVVRAFDIPPEKTILMGDSGGDGPHFEWGAGIGAGLIGSMTKPSLETYCQKNGIVINTYFGPSYPTGEKKDPKREMQVNFMDLAFLIEEFLKR